MMAMPQAFGRCCLPHQQQARQRARDGADRGACHLARTQVVYPSRGLDRQAGWTMAGRQLGQGLGCRVIPVGGQGNGTWGVVGVGCGLDGAHAHAVPVASCCHAYCFTGTDRACGTRLDRSRNYTFHWIPWIWGISTHAPEPGVDRAAHAPCDGSRVPSRGGTFPHRRGSGTRARAGVSRSAVMPPRPDPADVTIGRAYARGPRACGRTRLRSWQI